MARVMKALLSLAFVLPIIVVVPKAHAAQSFTIQLVSVAASGPQPSTDLDPNPSYISSDGRFVVFATKSTLTLDDSFPGSDIYIRDMLTNTTNVISTLGGSNPTISNDASLIAFENTAPYAPDDTNGVGDVYLFNRSNGELRRVSVSSSGTQGNYAAYNPTLSGDGRFLVYASASMLTPGDSSNSPDVFLYEVATATTTRIPTGLHQGRLSISEDGRYIYYVTPGGPYRRDVGNVLDRTTGSVITGLPPGGKLSGNGAYLGWVRDNWDNIMTLRDLSTGTDVVVGPGMYLTDLQQFALSYDARYVTFVGVGPTGGTYVGGGVYLVDRLSGIASRPSSSATGVPAHGYFPAISRNGEWVSFSSSVSSLSPEVPGTNRGFNVFLVRDLAPDPPILTTPISNSFDTIDVYFDGTAEPLTTVWVMEGTNILGKLPVSAAGSFGGYVTIDSGTRALAIVTASQSDHPSSAIAKTITLAPHTIDAPIPLENNSATSKVCSDDPVLAPSIIADAQLDASTGDFMLDSTVDQQWPTPGVLVSKDRCVGVMGAGVYGTDTVHPYLALPSKGQWQVEVSTRIDRVATLARQDWRGSNATATNSRAASSVAFEWVATYETCAPSCRAKSTASFSKTLGVSGNDQRISGTITQVKRIDVPDLTGARIGIEWKMNAIAELQGGGSSFARTSGKIMYIRIRKAR